VHILNSSQLISFNNELIHIFFLKPLYKRVVCLSWYKFKNYKMRLFSIMDMIYTEDGIIVLFLNMSS